MTIGQEMSETKITEIMDKIKNGEITEKEEILEILSAASDEIKRLKEIAFREDDYEKLFQSAKELMEYTSYAEIVGGVSVNRLNIRKYCDEIADIVRNDTNEKMGWFEYETKNWNEIVTERKRQIIEEKYDDAHDDEFTHGELASAAASYALPIRENGQKEKEWNQTLEEIWPFNWKHWKPNDTDEGRRHDLIKAGALILAEMDRLKRNQNKRT